MELEKNPWVRYVDPFALQVTVSSYTAGHYFLKKLNEAVEWQAKHQMAFAQLSAAVPAGTVLKWSEMISKWNKCADAEDPYSEPVLGEC